MQATQSPASAALALFRQTYIPSPGQTFHYCLSGVDLVCELDYSRATGDGWNEPYEPESADLCEALCAGTDIADLLSPEQKAEIETAFLEQDRSDE